MNPKNDLTQSAQSRPALPLARRIKRFRIERLEERIAPSRERGHFNPQSKWVGGSFPS